MTDTLLVELLTEELPPKALPRLGQQFSELLAKALRKHEFLSQDSKIRWFATPRRIAAAISSVLDVAPDREVIFKGPSVKVGLNSMGKPTAALLGFARKCGVAVDALVQVNDGKQAVFAHKDLAKGGALAANLDLIVEEAIKALPIPRVMRWGTGDAEFVRPVHGLVLLHGGNVVPGNVLGLEAGIRTRGHRFMGDREIDLKNAEEYESRLRDDGRVIADFLARRTEIARLLAEAAERERAVLAEHAALLDEVAALVEYPSVYVGRFERKYLDVPQECLILTMRQNQKYFPLFDADGALLPKFLIVSNMQVSDARQIVAGNERVVRPRLEDARFFYDQDRRRRLEERVPQLARVVFHGKLGSQLERVQRVQLLAGRIAREFGGDPMLAERAAWLSKADLVTDMVGEFPELQGIMGSYYAKHDGEEAAVVAAIRDQYRLRFDETSPENLVSAALYLADRVDTLSAMFAVDNAPTGDKDPFGLRRAALGVISVYEMLAAAARRRERAIPDLREVLVAAVNALPADLAKPGITEMIYEFVLERYRNSLANVYAKNSIDAVISQQPHLSEVVARVRAVEEFRKLPEAESLAAANKRIRNILVKSPPPSEHSFSERLFADEAERELFSVFQRVDAVAGSALANRRFAEALTALAVLKEPVDSFFDRVMVNVEDAALRNNRLMLLQKLDAAMNRVADIARLAQ